MIPPFDADIILKKLKIPETLTKILIEKCNFEEKEAEDYAQLILNASKDNANAQLSAILKAAANKNQE